VVMPALVIVIEKDGEITNAERRLDGEGGDKVAKESLFKC